MAVALLWMVTLGGASATQSDEELISDSEKSSSTNSTRQVSCFLNGLLTVIARLLNSQPITLGRLLPISFNHFQDLAFSNSS